MKGLFASAAMFAAIGTAALAQQNYGAPTAPAETAVTPPTGTTATAMPPATDPAAAPGAMSAGAPASATDTTAAVNPEGGDYPICRTRDQDRCRVLPRGAHHHHRKS